MGQSLIILAEMVVACSLNTLECEIHGNHPKKKHALNIGTPSNGGLMQMLKVIRAFKYIAGPKAGLSRKLKLEFDVWKHGGDEKTARGGSSALNLAHDTEII